MTTEGILLINKEKGSTSFKVVAQVRRALSVKKVGHAGTLDPLATGLLIILVGSRYTKQSAYLTAHNKRYLATIFFGNSTTTDDREGEIVAEGDASLITRELLLSAINKFLGTQQQIPPYFSAKSVGGIRSYKRARNKEQFELPPSTVTFHTLDLISFDNSLAVIDISCSKGTYIRSFARDLGKALGVPAHLYDLHRTASGDFDVVNAIDQSELANHEGVLRALSN